MIHVTFFVFLSLLIIDNEPPPTISLTDSCRQGARSHLRYAEIPDCSTHFVPSVTAPKGASKTPRHRRFLPGSCPCGTCWPWGCTVLPSFGPCRGWLLLPDLCRHFRIPTNCSLLTANCNRPLFYKIVRISSAATSIRLNANIFLPKSLRDAPR